MMESFGEILKDLKQESDLSLRKIGEGAGVSSSQLSRYMKSTIPSLPVGVKLANYFDCTLDYLFGISDNKKEFDFKKTFDLSKFVGRYEKLLKQNQLSNWQLAQISKLNESSLRQWKKGVQPKFDSLIIISQNLGVSIDYLVGRTDKK